MTGVSVIDTRSRLLDAAEGVFAQHGYHQARVDDIVAAAGTAKGTFYLYFPHKEAAFLAVVERFTAALVADVATAVTGTHGAAARLRAALEAGLDHFVRHPGLAQIFLVEAVGASDTVEAARLTVHRTLAQFIGEQAQLARPDASTAEVLLYGEAVLGAVQEVVVLWLAAEHDPVLLAETVPWLVDFCLRGLGLGRGDDGGGIRSA